MSDTTVTITIEEQVWEALRLLADLGDWTIEECAKRYLSEALVAAAGTLEADIQEGEEAIERGEYLTYDETKAWLAKERAEVLAEMERAKAA